MLHVERESILIILKTVPNIEDHIQNLQVLLEAQALSVSSDKCLRGSPARPGSLFLGATWPLSENPGCGDRGFGTCTSAKCVSDCHASPNSRTML